MFIHYSFQIIYIYINLSEPFHVANRVRPGGVLLKSSNIKAGYYIGEILLNHLTFVDDIYVFCPSVRGLQRILDVCQADAGLHEIISTAAKLFVWCLRLRLQKA